MKIAVIGAGAAGMMCTATINELNQNIEVYLIEKIIPPVKKSLSLAVVAAM